MRKAKGWEWGIKWKGERMIKEIISEIAREKLKTKKSNNKFDCSNLQQPEDITSQCDYKDEFPNGRNDKKWVACCQSKDDGNNYDELKNFYEEHFSEEERNMVKKY